MTTSSTFETSSKSKSPDRKTKLRKERIAHFSPSNIKQGYTFKPGLVAYLNCMTIIPVCVRMGREGEMSPQSANHSGFSVFFRNTSAYSGIST